MTAKLITMRIQHISYRKTSNNPKHLLQNVHSSTNQINLWNSLSQICSITEIQVIFQNLFGKKIRLLHSFPPMQIESKSSNVVQIHYTFNKRHIQKKEKEKHI